LYHLGLNVIIWDETLSSGTTVIIWDAMVSSGADVIIWDKMLSSGANVMMVLSGAYVIIWCYHVMLSSGMITHPFYIFPENFTHSFFETNFLIVQISLSFSFCSSFFFSCKDNSGTLTGRVQ
jgi:hypothetical protein